MLYGNYDFLMHYASGYELSRSTNIWLAQYHTQATYKGKYMMWQSTDKATVPGISKNVDLNFNVSKSKGIHIGLKDLAQLVRGRLKDVMCSLKAIVQGISDLLLSLVSWFTTAARSLAKIKIIELHTLRTHLLAQDML